MAKASLWRLALLASLHAVHAFSPSLYFNVSLDAIDAALIYGPELFTAKAIETWNVSFTNTPWNLYAPGRVGSGIPYRRAEANITADQIGTNPEVFLQYVGTSIYFVGTTQDTYPPPPGIAYSVSLTMESQDLSNATSTSDVLVSKEVDTLEYHTAVLSLNKGTIVFEGCNVTVGIETEVFDDLFNSTQLFVVDGKGPDSLSDFYNFDGQWEVETHIGGVNGQDSEYLPHAIGRAGQSVWVDIPANTSFVYLVGLVAPGLGRGFVEWSPNPPFGDRSSVFRAHSPWTNPSILHFATLDPKIEYMVKISALAPSNELGALPVSGIALTDMMFYSALKYGKLPETNGTSSTGGQGPKSVDIKSKPPIGAIVGGVVGGLLGLAALLAALIIFVCRKRKNKKKQPPMSENNVFNVDYEPDVVPFVPAPVRSETPADVPEAEAELLRPGSTAAASSFATSPAGVYGNKGGYTTSQLMGGAVLSSGPSRADSGVGSSEAILQSHSRASDAKSQMFQRPQSEVSFAQEQDAGAVPQSTMELIPPSYDESWQQNRPPTS